MVRIVKVPAEALCDLNHQCSCAFKQRRSVSKSSDLFEVGVVQGQGQRVLMGRLQLIQTVHIIHRSMENPYLEANIQELYMKS